LAQGVLLHDCETGHVAALSKQTNNEIKGGRFSPWHATMMEPDMIPARDTMLLRNSKEAEWPK
jgi:hypothetical protein